MNDDNNKIDISGLLLSVGKAMTQFIALHTDEELIRLGRRAANAKMEALTAVLAKEIELRDETEKRLAELNL
jgi:hypothetical protein